MPDQFGSSYAVDADAGYDASRLKGKSVIITGGASGLGEEFARQFVQAGAFVTIGDLADERASKLVSELGKENATYAKCNVLTWSDQVSLFKKAISSSPSKSVDVVVANAGISGADTVWRDDAGLGPDDDPIEPDLKILQVNLTGVMYTVKLATHYLTRNPEGSDRCLIMTASLAGYLDQPGSPQYCASKWGVRGIMRSLRRTQMKIGMRVNIIAPWFIHTPIMSDQVANLLADKGVVYAKQEDAGAAVLHMASDKSINGRSCAIVPRDIRPKGYMDLELDCAENDMFASMQDIVMKASHRIDTK